MQHQQCNLCYSVGCAHCIMSPVPPTPTDESGRTFLLWNETEGLIPTFFFFFFSCDTHTTNSKVAHGVFLPQVLLHLCDLEMAHVCFPAEFGMP